jgi:YtkA-like
MKNVQVIGLILASLFLFNYAVVPVRGAQAQAKHEYKISFRTDPSPAKGSAQNTFHVSVADSAGKSISDATVKIALVMPAMPEMGMAEMKVAPTVAWNGSDYSGKASIPSAGAWNVTIQVLKQDRVIASENTKLMAK